MRFQRSDLTPFQFISLENNLSTLGIVSDDLELSVDLWDARIAKNQGNEAYKGGTGHVKGSVLLVLDRDQIVFDANGPKPRIVPGIKGTIAAFLSPNTGNIPPDQIVQIPVRVKTLLLAWAIDKAIFFRLDLVGDFRGPDGQPRFAQLVATAINLHPGNLGT